MKSRKALLTRMLEMLVDEWGYDEVASALLNAKDASVECVELQQPQTQKKKVRLNAAEQIERAALPPEYKELLLQLAIRYDQKLFLPSVADVREFLSMMGENPAGMKDRTQAFRVLFQSLVRMPIGRLKQLAQTALHSGPSELGPLSDAIAAAGERLPRRSRND